MRVYCTVESVLHCSVPVSNHSLNKSLKKVRQILQWNNKYHSVVLLIMVKEILPVLIARIFPRSILHNLFVKPLNKVGVFFN